MSTPKTPSPLHNYLIFRVWEGGATKQWNQIVRELKDWAVFVEDLKVSAAQPIPARAY